MKFALSVAMFALGCPAVAGEAQNNTLACLEKLGAETEWATCLETMFAPCAGSEVGSEGHIACLGQQRSDWREAKHAAEDLVHAQLTPAGLNELTDLMLAWPKYVIDKCQAVAEGRAAISYDAADLGCQISEWAVMTYELRSCASGHSGESYCQLKSP